MGGEVSERESVVLVRSQGSGSASVCTGTLIAPNLVATARHCVSAFTDGDFSCTIDGFLDLDRPRSPATAGDMGFVYEPELVGIHLGVAPDFETPDTRGRAILAPESDTICRNDVAFVVLEDELDLPYETVRLDSGLEPNEEMRVIGYGLNDARRVERTERENVPLVAVGPSEFYSVEGNALPRTFVLGTSVCQGDSGGPAFSMSTGEVIGVFSLVRGDCESSEARNFFTQLAPFRDLAEQAYEEAGYASLLDDTAEPEPPGAGGERSKEESSGGSTDKGGCQYAPALRHWPGHFFMWAFCGLLFCARLLRRRAAPFSVGGRCP